jgi:hypothetical protein
MARLLESTLVAALVTYSTTSLAQVSATDAAMAEKLFEDARQLMAAQKYAEACPKLAESERLDPGVGTLLNLGECFEKSGKIASAWATYREADAAATHEGQKKRAAYAATRARVLARDLSYVVVEAPDPPAGLEITCDGRPISAASIGSPVPLDAGAHRIEARAPGRRDWSQGIELAVAATAHVVVRALDPELSPPPVPVVQTTLPPPEPSASSSDGRTQRIAGLAAGAAGLVAVGIGSYFGIRAKHVHDDAEAHHCSAVSCDQTGADMTTDARGLAAVSTVAFAVAASALAAGIVLYFTAPHAPKPVEPRRADAWMGLAQILRRPGLP